MSRRRPPAPALRPPSQWDSDAPFTQEEFPGLLPEAAAFFSTPLEDLDPELLHLSLAVVASKIAELMPPESGMPGAEALHATLWGQLAPQLHAFGPHAPPHPAPPTAAGSPPETPPAALPQRSPSAPPAASPAEQLASPPPPPRAQSPAPPRATHPQAAPRAAMATRQTAAAPPAFLSYPRRPVLTQPFRTSNNSRAPLRRALPQPAPLRHWCYAARASPA
ncbi:MAG TPA: hypothetical protein VMB73_12800 [Acetobacteraceae bacterium]|nr:hypothetical protein [Acetobacteraceae bacterium]